MFKAVFIIMVVVGIAESNKCYKYGGPKVEFTSQANTCDDGMFCGTTTLETRSDLILTGCIPQDCSSETTISLAKMAMSIFVRMTGGELTEKELNTVKLECCEGDFCQAPTSIGNPGGVECYKYNGTKSEMKEKATKCNHGSSCLKATARDMVALGCLVDCTDEVKKEIRTTLRIVESISAHIAGQPALTDDEVNVECCTDNLCNLV